MVKILTYNVSWWLNEDVHGTTPMQHGLYVGETSQQAAAAWRKANPDIKVSHTAYDYRVERVTPYSKDELKELVKYDRWWEDTLLIRSIVELL